MYILSFDYFICCRFQLPVHAWSKFVSFLAPDKTARALYICLLWEPLHIPSADSFDIPHNELESSKVERSDRIEPDVEND
jgi:hypothetical protein